MKEQDIHPEQKPKIVIRINQIRRKRSSSSQRSHAGCRLSAMLFNLHIVKAMQRGERIVWKRSYGSRNGNHDPEFC